MNWVKESGMSSTVRLRNSSPQYKLLSVEELCASPSDSDESETDVDTDGESCT